MARRSPTEGMWTRAVHAGELVDPHGAPHTPLYDHTTFADPGGPVDDNRRRVAFYTRYGANPTLWAVQDKIAGLHESASALVFGSGMAAISAALLATLVPGERVVSIGTVYGGTHDLLTRLGGLGIESFALPTSQLQELPHSLSADTRVVFVETPSTPLLEVVDLQQLAVVAHAVDALLIVDNTLASPINQRPLAHGADLVVESATKSLGGHSDLTGGMVAGPEDLIARVDDWRRSLGQIMAPETAHRLARSLRTLPLRIQRHNDTAVGVADWLAEHPRIRTVHHPSRATGATAELVDRQMHGPGGLLSFVVEGGAQAAQACLEQLRLITVAPSLGGTETLATRPSATSHRDLTAAERHDQGIDDGMIRLSCGLEDSADLIADLANALPR